MERFRSGQNMSSEKMKSLLRQADSLTVDEQLQLAAYLLERVRRAEMLSSVPPRKWREICGIASYPVVGEDAQEWVSRSRRESDEHREQQWKIRP